MSSFLWAISLYAQNKQANNWYFGHNAGITFNTPDGSPQVLYDGQIHQWEGCASISDATGNLLFYTDGLTVWNAQHDTMPNGTGLNGNPSATMSSIVVPAPGSDSLHYLFTVPVNTDSTGLCYSIVNMNLSSGLGDITDTKNTYLTGPVQEAVTSVGHADGISFWVITHLWNTNTFHLFLVDQDSLHTIPQSCSVGDTNSGDYYTVYGYLKASIKGNKLAMVVSDEKYVQLFNFNPNDGSISDPISLYPPGWYKAYGLEFSPDESKLYVGLYKSSHPPVSKIIQYDISSNDSATIVNSGIEVAEVSNSYSSFGALQVGPDMRMYIARNFHPYLSIIEQPDSTGNACNYIDSAILLDDGSGTFISRLGLPAFIQSFFNYANFTWEGHCIGDTTFFAITDTASQDSVFWDFGDTTTGILNNSTSFFPYHIYSDTGSFQVSVIGYNNSLNDTTLQEVFIHPLPVPFLPTDTGFCEGYGVNLWPGNFQSYLWQNGSMDTSFYADTTLSVIVEVTDIHACKATDSTHAVEHSKPDPLLIFHD